MWIILCCTLWTILLPILCCTYLANSVLMYVIPCKQYFAVRHTLQTMFCCTSYLAMFCCMSYLANNIVLYVIPCKQLLRAAITWFLPRYPAERISWEETNSSTCTLYLFPFFIAHNKLSCSTLTIGNPPIW